jgi:hypothetical protein
MPASECAQWMLHGCWMRDMRHARCAGSTIAGQQCPRLISAVSVIQPRYNQRYRAWSCLPRHALSNVPLNSGSGTAARCGPPAPAAVSGCPGAGSMHTAVLQRRRRMPVRTAGQPSCTRSGWSCSLGGTATALGRRPACPCSPGSCQCGRWWPGWLEAAVQGCRLLHHRPPLQALHRQQKQLSKDLPRRLHPQQLRLLRAQRRALPSQPPALVFR